MKKYLPKERLNKIVELVEEKSSLDVVSMSKILKVSPATIRRDLNVLQSKNIIGRTHGGAVSNLSSGFQEEYLAILNKSLAEKQRIGKVASEYIENGETIILEGSTTVIHIAKNLSNKSGLTVITNSPYIALEIVNRTKNKVIFIAGELNPKILSTNGLLAEKVLSEFRADKAFLSISAVDSEYNMTTALLDVSYVKKAIIKSAREVIGVADHTKFGKTALNVVAPIELLNKLITDKKLPEHHLKKLKEMGIEVILA